ncbi:hypothetical protein AMATHDRAFT_72323 [Amanita thiersii Skay4041]|uniref:Cation efflux protein n=1 Tax=Amanita thiersii Skay4041 TaxID=703135 RepID=A0A2A9NY94_9AGAR|nr:hypothetical protein AMATHDRAFT_72323 [Amanita thiersii Skay4041]
MPFSRSARITLLLVIDVLFFLIELIVGLDVMSLIVALYAIKLTATIATDSRYSYGWHRAEILAALINGVFLLALCFSISLEALERFFTTPEISSPKLVVIVGSLGLGSNIIGLLLFHEHTHGHGHSHTPSPATSKPPSVRSVSQPAPETDGTALSSRRPLAIPIRARTLTVNEENYSSLYGHPAATRASLVQTANEMAFAHPQSPTASPLSATRSRPSMEVAPLDKNLSPQQHVSYAMPSTSEIHSPSYVDESSPLLNNTVEGESVRHPHSGSMNMRALVLHVLGDALGNVGVIATGLIIWLSSWQYKYYCDPVISLVITVIIFSSALPLVRSASFILLQGVPPTISLDRVRQSILDVEGVLSLHELHVWQLSESKIVASVHVLASRNHDFMPVAANIRKVLHHHGIHSSTIQPEYHHINGPPDEHLKNNQDTSCLILCPADEECNPMENACCHVNV